MKEHCEMTNASQPFDLTIAYKRVEEGWIQAMVPAVPGVITVGRTKDEARDGALDALREMLAAGTEHTERDVTFERVRVRLETQRRDLGRGL
jgi:predicted RNase H-like HicB family nuclease